MKIDRRYRQQLLQISKELPDTYQKGKAKFVDFITDTQDHEIMNNTHGQELTIVKREKALFTKTVFVKVNHYKKLKKAFKKDGIKGVEDYIKWVMYNNRKLNAEHKMKLTMLTANEILKHKIKPLF